MYRIDDKSEPPYRGDLLVNVRPVKGHGYCVILRITHRLWGGTDHRTRLISQMNGPYSEMSYRTISNSQWDHVHAPSHLPNLKVANETSLLPNEVGDSTHYT
jgi:hypothetical protein